MPLKLDDTSYFEAPLKVYLDHEKVSSIVKSNLSLQGNDRVKFATIILPSAGTWKIICHGRFTHPNSSGKHLYTWIDYHTNWTSTEWTNFFSNEQLKQTFQAIKIENNDNVDINISTIITITDTEPKTFNWSFSTDDSSATTEFFLSTFGTSNNPLISAVQYENQALFFGFKISS